MNCGNKNQRYGSVEKEAKIPANKRREVLIQSVLK
jgi:hypothetical protein